MPSIEAFLREMVERGASDLHMTTQSPPMIRLHGELTPIAHPPLTASDTKNLCYSLLTEGQKKRFEEESELDFSFGIRGVARFRGNMYNQKGAVGGAFRTIPHQTPQLHQLGLPPAVIDMTKLPRGLVLVTGPTGSGKSTTLAAMIDKINRERKEHIVSVEDPIEFVHEHKGCLVNQREVFADTNELLQALKHVLRQDPDIVLIGEMRDLETIEAALVVAETGHLVFRRCTRTAPCRRSTASSTSSRRTSRRRCARSCPTRAAGRDLATADPAPRQPRPLPRRRSDAAEPRDPEPHPRGEVHQIYSQMQVGQTKFGMQTMGQSLTALVQQNLITVDEALGHATELEELKQMLGVNRTPGTAPAQPARAAGR
jgi:twitching motility protein PilT